jgi:glucose-6-phosphate 1-dehydrogenase
MLDEYLQTEAGRIPSMEQSGHELTGETIIVVLGASGDLAKKKTFPALFGLFKDGYLPEDLHIIGYARSKLSDEEFKDRQIGHIKAPKEDATAEEKSQHDEKLKKFQEISSYISGAYDQDDGFQALTKAMEEIEGKRSEKGSGPNRIFYMALPPSVFTVVATNLKKNCYEGAKTARIVIEKPFGKDLDSCREMMTALKKVWSEDETYRIDHYLGKEMVKNLLLLRFGNTWIESSWNKNYISNVQITFKEPFGTEGRGGYFDEFGIIRDVCQNREFDAGLRFWIIAYHNRFASQICSRLFPS